MHKLAGRKKILTVLFLLAIMNTPSVFAQENVVNVNYDNNSYSQLGSAYYNKGVELLKANNYTEAIAEFRKALRENPTDKSARIQLVNTYLERAQYYNNKAMDYNKAANDLRSAIFYMKYYTNEPVEAKYVADINTMEDNLATILNNNGYDTVFIQSSKRNSFYLDIIAKSIGFKEYYGMEDLDEILDYPDKKASQFGWDYETYMKLHDVLKNKGKDKPFFAFLFTGTTHIPYAEPNSINVKFPHNTSNENGFKNTLVYADWSLGEFMKKMENEPFFNNTIFIFTADHVLGKFEKTEFPEDYHVPLLIYSPAFKEKKEYTFTTNHIDLASTILDIAGLYTDRSEYIGDSVFCKDNESFSIVHSYGSAKIIKNDKWLIHSFADILETSPKDMNEEEKNNLAKILLSYYQESRNIMMGKYR